MPSPSPRSGGVRPSLVNLASTFTAPFTRGNQESVGGARELPDQHAVEPARVETGDFRTGQQPHARVTP